VFLISSRLIDKPAASFWQHNTRDPFLLASCTLASSEIAMTAKMRQIQPGNGNYDDE